MIQFYGRMYNYTDGEFIDSSPRLYSIAQYVGSSIAVGDDGTTRTDIPFTEFVIDAGTNIGTAFEFCAKQYFDINNAWPVLRLCTSNDPSTYFIEWVHSNPTGFNLKSPSMYVRWSSSFQWSDTYTVPNYNNMYSFVFSSASSVDDLMNIVISWSGAVRANNSTGNVDTLISYATFQISAPSNCLVSNAGAFLGQINERVFYKTYDGPMITVFQQNSDGWTGPISFCPAVNNGDMPPYNGSFTANEGISLIANYKTDNDTLVPFTARYQYHLRNPTYVDTAGLPILRDEWDVGLFLNVFFDSLGIQITYIRSGLYEALQGDFTQPGPPPSDVDPDNPPDPDTPPTPIPPDNPDPYYDPTSDPDSPEYDPKKDPDSPEYDPDDPASPYRPPSTEGGGDPEVKPPVDPVTPPPAPPSHAINSRFVTLYTPSLSQLNDLAAYLWSPAWSIDGFKKIFANPMDCILGLMIFPALASPSGSKEVNVGNLSTGVTMSYIDNQYVEVNCGSFEITEYYASYLDYDPYTKIEIYLPYIGTHRLSADDVMAKTIQLKYMIDLLSGACVAFLVVDGTTLYTFTGSCATPIPVSGNDWSNMVNGILSVAGAAAAAVISGGTAATMAAGAVASTSLFVSSHKEHIRHGGSVASAAGLMSIQTPYLIVTRPRQALPLAQNSFQGYPSFMTESLGSLSGYTEVESCHLEHIPCTAEELEEIERLLKGGVLF